MNLDKICNAFDISIKSIKKEQDSYKCFTNKGLKQLKESKFSRGKILFQHNAKEYLWSKGFENLIRFDLTSTDKLPYYIDDDTNNCYIIQSYKELPLCDFSKESDLELAIRTLATFHIASCGFEPMSECKIKSDIGDLDYKFEKKLEELVKFKNKTKKISDKNKFDEMFFNNVDYYVDMGYKAIDVLGKSTYDEIEEREKEQKSFCHYDYGNNNLLIDKNKIIIKDFDYCGYEIRMYDIACVIKKLVKIYGWDIGTTIKIIDIYSKYSTVPKGELEVLLSLLIFPQKFWKIVNNHYNSNVKIGNANEIAQLEYILDRKEEHKKYTEDLERLISV